MLKTFTKEQLTLAVTFLVCLSASLMLEWWARKCSFILTPDSLNYIAAAESFKVSGLFIGATRNYYTQWPPLFPLLLSLFDKPLVAMVWIQAVCKISIGLGVLFLANHFFKQLVFKAVFLVAVFFSVHLLLISVFLWSEIIFMALYMAHFWLSLNLHKGRRYYFALVVVAALMCLQRNAGLFLVFSTGLWMVLDQTLGMPKKIVKATCYVATCTLVLLSWYYYNIFFMTGSKPFYDRDFFAHTFLNVGYILTVLAHTFFPVQGKVAIIVGLVICFTFLFCWVRYFKNNTALLLPVLSVVVYTLCFLPVPDLNSAEMERYFAVILPVFLVLPLTFIEHITTHSFNRLVIGVFCLLLWLGYCFMRTGKNALLWREMSCSQAYKRHLY